MEGAEAEGGFGGLSCDGVELNERLGFWEGGERALLHYRLVDYISRLLIALVVVVESRGANRPDLPPCLSEERILQYSVKGTGS